MSHSKVWQKEKKKQKHLKEVISFMGFSGGSVVKNSPTMQEMQVTRVQSLGQQHPLDEAVATHFNILTWEMPRTEEPGGLQSLGSQRARHD